MESDTDRARRLLQGGISTAGTASTGGKRWIAPEPATLAGVFPQLEVIALIGQGGMGAVYRARQTHLDRLVALKIIPPLQAASSDASLGSRFRREGLILAKLRHPHIVCVHDVGEAGGWHYLIMELIEGATLREVMATGPFTAGAALSIAPQLCDALSYAHRQGVVHRDLKPENIIIDRAGRAHVTDFGLAKLTKQGEDPTITRTGEVLGTAAYMAPEQLANAREVDHRADLYALGVIFYEMLTGALPLGAFEKPSRLARLDVRVDEVVLHALERTPEMRWQSADDMRRAVDALRQASQLRASAWSRPSLWLLSAAMILIGIGLGVMFARGAGSRTANAASTTVPVTVQGAPAAPSTTPPPSRPIADPAPPAGTPPAASVAAAAVPAAPAPARTAAPVPVIVSTAPAPVASAPQPQPQPQPVSAPQPAPPLVAPSAAIVPPAAAPAPPSAPPSAAPEELVDRHALDIVGAGQLTIVASADVDPASDPFQSLPDGLVPIQGGASLAHAAGGARPLAVKLVESFVQLKVPPQWLHWLRYQGSGELIVRNISGTLVLEHLGRGSLTLDGAALDALDVRSGASGITRLAGSCSHFQAAVVAAPGAPEEARLDAPRQVPVVDADDLLATTIDATVDGGAELRLAGMARAVTIHMSTGTIFGSHLGAEHADVTILGTGHASLGHLDALDVSIHGSGELRYEGRPAIGRKDLNR